MGDIPILKQGQKTRSFEQQQLDSQIAASFAELALAAEKGEIRAFAYVVLQDGKPAAQTNILDNLVEREKLVFSLNFLQHALVATEYNARMAALPGGQPKAAP
jgi:hypothetical protein